MRMNIAIDGPSAAGKSTIAKLLAKTLHYSHLDTGAMYRCVAYASKVQNVNVDDENAVAEVMNHLNIRFDEQGKVYLNDEDVSLAIRTNDISMLTSKVSAYPAVRKGLVDLQRSIAKNKGYILDGRDIGSVVLPDAEVKIYMVASAQARAKRRYDEYIAKGIEADFEEILKDIEQRDYQDMNRAVSPLTKCDDATEIDTSNMSIDEVVATIMDIITKQNEGVEVCD